jgi:hypothetical protein
MPWVMRESHAPAARLRRRVRNWTYDHSTALTAVWIGGACAAGVLLILKVAGFIG